MTLRTTLACAAFALSAACGSESETPSAEQNREMDSAAEMLDDAPNSLSAVDDGGLEQEMEAQVGNSLPPNAAPTEP